MKQLKRLTNEGLWVLVAQFGSVLIGLLLLRTLTKILPPNAYGNLALVMTFGNAITQVFLGGITAGMARYYPIAMKSRDTRCYVYSCKKLLFYLAILVSTVSLICCLILFYLDLEEIVVLSSLSLLAFLVSGLNTAFNALQNSARNRGVYALLMFLESLFKLLAVLIFANLFKVSLGLILGLFVLSSSAVLVLQLFLLPRVVRASKKDTSETSAYWIRSIFLYSLPFSSWGLFSWIQQSSDKWAIKFFLSSSDVGLYSVLFQLGYSPMSLMAGLGVTFISPFLFKLAGDKSSTLGKKSASNLAIRSALFCLGLTLIMFVLAENFHSHIFRYLVSSEYEKSSHFLPWLILAGGVFSAGEIVAVQLMGELKTSKLISIKITTSVIGILLNVLFAFYGGLAGIVFAINIYSLVYFFWVSHATLVKA